MVNGRTINNLLHFIPVSSEYLGAPRRQSGMYQYAKEEKGEAYHRYKAESNFATEGALPELFRNFDIVQQNDNFFVAKLSEGRVWGESGAVVTKNDTFISDVSREFNANMGLEHSIFYTIRQKKPVYYPGEVAVIGTVGYHIYYHWMIDILPRLGILEKAASLAEIDFFVTGYQGLRFQAESLRMLGIPAEKIIPSIDNWRFHIKAEKLLVPSLAGTLDQPNSFQIEYLRQAFKEHINPGQPYRKIYVSRRKAGRRCIQNENAFLPQLIAMGIEIVDCEELSLSEQVKLFSESAVIVGSHGSAFTNLVFCHASTQVLEVFNETHVNPCFWLIAEHRRLRYFYLQGQSVPVDNNRKNDSTVVDADAFLEKIDRLLQDS